MTAQRTARKELSEVKQPEDHKQAIQDVTVELRGESFTVKGKALKDYRLLLLLNKMEQNGAYLPEVMERILGQEQHEKVIDLLSDPDDNDYVDTEDVGNFLRTLMEEAKAKNS
ncbi:hypothetical protein [Paenarthrobacter sp. YJN-5]|uniref:hypothetical protein n=1 Tax=Paenarthrobacter sp. YJN-5 TaxID=2735316 RepID=UPI00187788EF|nr:hypothetical protein [Paenarthrobacter sp. YJN-5]QOT19736.1 hypothetical protein HMI59_24045 [Paenarthrobacter sp. YJN-5]